MRNNIPIERLVLVVNGSTEVIQRHPPMTNNQFFRYLQKHSYRFSHRQSYQKDEILHLYRSVQPIGSTVTIHYRFIIQIIGYITLKLIISFNHNTRHNY